MFPHTDSESDASEMCACATEKRAIHDMSCRGGALVTHAVDIDMLFRVA